MRPPDWHRIALARFLHRLAYAVNRNVRPHKPRGAEYCHHCGGTGLLDRSSPPVASVRPTAFKRLVTCEDCAGVGTRQGQTCFRCGGQGALREIAR